MDKAKLVDTFKNFMGTVLTTPALAFCDLVHPEVVWVNIVPEHVPFGGKYEGIQALVQYLTELTMSIKMGPLEYHEFYAEEDSNTVVVVGEELDSVSLTTGRTYNMPFVWIAKFNDEGRLIYCREHNDTRALSAAFE
jgi:ketosteroid isomerase-like protein